MSNNTQAPIQDDIQRLQALLETSPLHRALRLRVVGANRELREVRISIPLDAAFARDDSAQQYHGGTIATLVDITGDFALILMLGHGVPTINIRIDYLKAAKVAPLTGVARVRRAGRSVGVVDIEVEDGKGEVVALGRGCYSTRPG